MIGFNRSSRVRRGEGRPTEPFGAGRAVTPWLAALTVAWPQVDEALFDLTVAALAKPATVSDWGQFSTDAVSRGIAEATEGQSGPTLTFSPAWRELVERHLGEDGIAEVPLPNLVRHWLNHPDPRCLEQVTWLARRLELWRELEAIWRDHLRIPDLTGVTRIMRAFRSIPEEARGQSPLLSWASAVAAMHQSRERATACALSRLLIRDAVALHSRWFRRAEPDARILGGTMWMTARWLLPSERPAEAVEFAWRTRMAIKDALSRSELTNGASPMTQVIFRTFSSQLALARGDPQTAFAEARQAGILGPHEPGLSSLAKGVEVLSACLLGLSDAPPPSPRSRRRSSFPGLGDLRDTGLAMTVLASGLSALDRLDREGTALALESVTAAEVAGGGLWSVRATIEAMYGALWCELAPTLEQLDASAATFACTVAEDAEPLGRRLVGNARVVLLNMLGATDAAREATAFLTEDTQWLARARTHLWAGEIDEAAQAALAGLVDARTWPRDRAHLLATKAAAHCLNLSDGEGAQRAAARAAVTRCWTTRNLLALALLPSSARQALLDNFEEGAGPRDRAIAAQIRAQLAQLVGRFERDLVRIRLTRREQVLLPLLATTEPVPDIARRLHLSTNTVRKQVVTLRAKFQAASRAELVRSAREAGLLH